MVTIYPWSKAFALLVLLTGLAWASGSPVVISTRPANGGQAVPSSLDRICATFDMEMRPGNWSWAYADKAKFPELAGEAHYEDGMKTNCLPVTLRAGTQYEIWINSARHQNFKSKAGVPAVPYLLRFRTGR